jgi:AraC-like DNA-binding protein
VGHTQPSYKGEDRNLHSLIEPTIYARLFLDILDEERQDSRKALRGTGLTPGFLARPDARISLAQQIHFYGNIGKLDDATRLSLVHGSRVRIEHHGVLGYAARSAKNLRSALQTFNGFFNVIGGVARLTLIEDRDIARWVVASLIPSGPARRVAIGEMLAGNLALMQLVTGQKLSLKEVVLDEASEQDLQTYAAHFACPVSCDHENIELRFDSALLNIDLAFADPQAEEECIEYCRQSIARIDAQSGLSGVTRRLLMAQPDMALSLEGIAARLNMSPRTFRRHLKTEGTTFLDLRDEVRLEAAKHYLRFSAKSIDQVAIELGYSEPSNFRHAFKRWTGSPPSAFRKKSIDERTA